MSFCWSQMPHCWISYVAAEMFSLRYVYVTCCLKLCDIQRFDMAYLQAMGIIQVSKLTSAVCPSVFFLMTPICTGKKLYYHSSAIALGMKRVNIHLYICYLLCVVNSK